MSNQSKIRELLKIMERLRDPKSGCPWDVEQDFKTIAPYTVEEAYEVADAIDKEDYIALKDELGDLLFQVVFHAQIAQEKEYWNFEDVVEAVSNKMVRRHPHVFGSSVIKDADAQIVAWEQQKAAERAEKEHQDNSRSPSALNDIPHALPALLRALKLQKRAATVGFDWADVSDVVAKILEEIAELSEELAKNAATERSTVSAEISEEYGDLLFVCTNLGRHLGVNPEEALRQANSKFERRFRGVENKFLQEGKAMNAAKLDEMEAHWNAVKKEEKKSK